MRKPFIIAPGFGRGRTGLDMLRVGLVGASGLLLMLTSAALEGGGGGGRIGLCS